MLDDSLRPILKNNDNDFELREIMKARGMQFLSNQLIALLLDGTTGLDEIIRVGVKEA
jgi:type II secretory ATPase GspE/PulE/Tfp pilus assembly ATPase PilB-like protein